MSDNISVNSCFKYNGKMIKIIERIGAGGQAEVYKVCMDNKEYAFKYYFKGDCTPEVKENLLHLIKNPIKSKSFVWPLFFVEVGDRFGYVMDLLPKGYKNVCQWISNEFDMSLVNLFKVCLNLSFSFYRLYMEGYSYKDISLSNITFNPLNGDVCILDNDNITENLKTIGIMGTSKFMAPEIVSGYTKKPTRLTDLHALAVLLFIILHCEHPLNGKKEYNMEDNDNYEKELYGLDTACFIFKNPFNLDENIVLDEPAHVNAREMFKFYPKELQNLFRRAFTEGITDSSKRPVPFEWIEIFSKMLREFYFCPNCNSPGFFNYEELKRNKGQIICNNCEQIILLPFFRIDLKKRYSKGEEFRYGIINNNTEFFPSYFDFDDNDIRVLFHSEFENGRLRFFNDSGVEIVYNGRKIEKNQYTDYMDYNGDLHVLYINGVKLVIAIYR